MDGIVLSGTMHEICATLQIDLDLFGNVLVSEYKVIQEEIAKYNISAVNFYKRKKHCKVCINNVEATEEDVLRLERNLKAGYERAFAKCCNGIIHFTTCERWNNANI